MKNLKLLSALLVLACASHVVAADNTGTFDNTGFYKAGLIKRAAHVAYYKLTGKKLFPYLYVNEPVDGFTGACLNNTSLIGASLKKAKKAEITPEEAAEMKDILDNVTIPCSRPCSTSGYATCPE